MSLNSPRSVYMFWILKQSKPLHHSWLLYMVLYIHIVHIYILLEAVLLWEKDGNDKIENYNVLTLATRVTGGVQNPEENIIFWLLFYKKNGPTFQNRANDQGLSVSKKTTKGCLQIEMVFYLLCFIYTK